MAKPGDHAICAVANGSARSRGDEVVRQRMLAARIRPEKLGRLIRYWRRLEPFGYSKSR
jgi:hypothetical protein